MLKRSSKFFLFALMLFAAAMMFGCGSDGSDGAAGAAGLSAYEIAVQNGFQGTEEQWLASLQGESATSATAETCAICHGEGKIAAVADKHPDSLALLGDDVIISNISLTNNGGPVVAFHLERAVDGTPITGLTPADVDLVRFVMGDLVPAGTPTDPTGFDWGTFDTDYWEQWGRERSGGDYPQGTLDVTGEATGDYVYTFVTQFGSAQAMTDAPDLDHTPGASHIQRMFIRFDGSDDPTIFLSNGRGVGFLDFIVPAADGVTPATPLDPQRQFVTSSACEKCHSANWERAPGGHASGRRDIKACVLCHSPIGFDQFESDPVEANRGQFMQDNDAYASIFYHKIHAAIDIDPEWSNRIGGRGYGAVTFPQVDANGELRDCVICHNNDAGEALGGQAALIDNWKTEPSREICVSCHTDVDFDTGTNHGGGPQDNNGFCEGCHPSDGGGFGRSIANAHDITPHIADPAIANDQDYLPENIPEFDVTLTVSAYPNGTHFVSGDVIDVTATLANHSDGTPVSALTYTSSRDAAGATNGILREAYVQFSGPRAMAVPVLATDTFSDPNWLVTPSPTGQVPDPETLEDEHDMFMDSTDPQVTTTSAGFGYQTLAIPADIEPGTYIVRVVFADYGRVGSGDYHIDSTDWQLIQIGTATVEPKVSGDACVDCHGTGTAPFHDERHSVPFDTDQCLACHHNSFNDLGERAHGSPLANRVHAVHSASMGGDIRAILSGDPTSHDWSDVTYPREIQNCNTCHNSQFDATDNTFEGTYKTLPYMMPCSGCHVGESFDFTGALPFVPGLYDHMVQNGGPWLMPTTP
jgi:hypothetical protein